MKKYHGHEKSYNLIKEYSDKFLEALEKDEDLEILEIIGEEYASLKEEINGLKNKLREVNKGMDFEIEKEIADLKKQVNSLEAQAKDKETEVDFERKKIDKSESRKKEIFSQIEKSKLFSDLDLKFNSFL